MRKQEKGKLFFFLYSMLTLCVPYRKNLASEYYDTSDPFIGDSKFALEKCQFFAQTKQRRFYVSSDDVTLKYAYPLFLLLSTLPLSPCQKPKSKKISFAHSHSPPQKSKTPLLMEHEMPPIIIDGENKQLKLDGGVIRDAVHSKSLRQLAGGPD